MENKITDREHRIRDLVNDPWQRELIFTDKVKWNKVCSCMDVIGDSQMAISDYLKLPEFSASNGGYLYLYGLLQAFFLQQDAVNHLSIALFDEEINWKRDFAELYEIRELRNDAIGHPTNRNNKSLHFITRYSLTKNFFQLSSHFPSEGRMDMRSIYITELLEKQEKSIISILDKAIIMMEENLKNHKKKFSDKKLIDIIPDSWGYYVSKVYEGIYSNHPLAEMHFRLILDVYENLKKGIVERYESISVLIGVQDEVRKIDYIANM